MRISWGLIVGAAMVASACAGNPAETAQKFALRAAAHEASGRYEAAAIEYRNAIKHAPAWGDAHRNLGHVQKVLGDPDGAFKSYREACRLAPNDIPACLDAVQLLLAGGHASEAAQMARDVVDRAPQDAQAAVVLASAAARLGRLGEAKTLLEGALQRSPGPEAYAALGDVRADGGDIEGAEAAFRAGVDRLPRSADARVHLARFLSESGRIGEAEVELVGALELEPTSEFANRALASLYIADDRSVEAEKYLKQAAAQPDQRYNSLIALADYHASAGRWDEARAVLDRAPREGVVAREARVRLAAVLYETGDHPAAHRTLDAVLAKKPTADAWTLQAQLFARERRLEEAVKAARNALALEPSQRSAHLIIAAVERERGNISAADEALQAAARDF